ncbi:amidohydrolase 2 [Lepidopterella palustris CBS 459.81]|uniref:6-methylsalicylate decarboxylase n=1 Tax=Lepidopterella palustris CBS 459.81 TaxID=1314670 RepID=A0A8E2JHC3_9PEZI|nr:amidohydrolase 2 [Lepidopterella palustris CBS 459.81]
MANKIDVHHHVYPPEYTKALEDAGGDPSGWSIPGWTLSADHAIKTSTRTRTAILSITAPGPSIAGNATASTALARKCNEFCAKIRNDDPKAYGFFACLPDILDAQAEAIEEIKYGLDVLKADGVVLYTRYGAGHTYLGDEKLVPVWEELNMRKTVVFVHPTHSVDTVLVNKSLPQPMIDYPHETGRTAMDLISQKRTVQFPDVKIILSHAGGTLPFLIDRVAGLMPFAPFDVGISTEAIYAEARKFYFDTALSGGEPVMRTLLELAEKDHVLFGSDFPNAPTEGIEYFTKRLEGLAVEKTVMESICFGAARKLFPRLAE